MSSSASLRANFASALGVCGSSSWSTSASVQTSPALTNAFLAVSDLSTMRWGEPLASGRRGEKGKDIHLRIPKHFRNLCEHPGEVFMGKRELGCFGQRLELLQKEC